MYCVVPHLQTFDSIEQSFLNSSRYFLISKHLGISLGTGFPGGSVVKNLPAKAGDTGDLS